MENAAQLCKKTSRILDDIETVIEGVADHDFTKDQTINALMGIAEVYAIRFEQLQHSISELGKGIE
jgi:hypothetical protein